MRGVALANGAGGGKIAADDLLPAGFAADIVVRYAKARHVNAHVGGAFIGGNAADAIHHGVENRENFDVTVIVDRCFAIGFKVVGVYHVNVVKVGRCRLIGEVYRMLEREVPYGEGLELRIARFHAALVLVIKLGKAGCHFAAAGSGSGYNDETARGFNIVVFSEAVVAYDKLGV